VDTGRDPSLTNLTAIQQATSTVPTTEFAKPFAVAGFGNWFRE
jgi:hypothetical protein